MLRLLFSLFLVLHGLVYLWYFTLSQRLVAFQPEMGWSGRSWLFSNLLGDAPLRTLASLLYVLATLGCGRPGLLQPTGVVARPGAVHGRLRDSDHPAVLGWQAAAGGAEGIDWAAH
jgi:hypothetical protein